MTTNQKSTAFSLHSPIAALVSVDDVIGRELVWCPAQSKEGVDERQKSFLAAYADCKVDAKTLPEVMGKASKDYQELNTYLAKNKSVLKFDKPFEPGKFGAVGIVRIGGQWSVPGTPLGILNEKTGKTLPAFKLASGDEVPGVLMHHSSGGALTYDVESAADEYVSAIRMKNGTIVYMTRCNEVPDRPEDLIAFAASLRKDCTERTLLSTDSKGGVRFPMVDLGVDVDLGWMPGMYAPIGGERILLEEAKMVASVQMNHLGAVAKVDTSMVMGITCVRKETRIWHELDGNFLVWFEKPGAQQPIVAAAYVSRESMKNPGDIDFSVVPTTKEA